MDMDSVQSGMPPPLPRLGSLGRAVRALSPVKAGPSAGVADAQSQSVDVVPKLLRIADLVDELLEDLGALSDVDSDGQADDPDSPVADAAGADDE